MNIRIRAGFFSMKQLELLKKCTVCPRNCKTNRYENVGYCNASDKIRINLSQLHFGEEPVLSGKNGSGTIFFSHCNLFCVFCQNYLISYYGNGDDYEVESLATMMLDLQKKKAHNINLVTPTHYTLQIIEAIKIAKSEGLHIPIVWNSSAYEEVKTLKKLEGLVDIYLPDLKYFDAALSLKYSDVPDYPEKAKAAIKEMFWQVGNLKLENNIAKSGIMIRILNLPDNINSVDLSLEWINKTFGSEIYISLMSQYYPTHKAIQYPEIARGINQKEFDFAMRIFTEYGFQNGFVQDLSSTNEWMLDFKKN